jgi:superfamily II DNA or RNA helicase
MITLRPYQEKIIEDIRQSFAAGHKRVIMCAPTGAGKTVMFTYMAGRALAKNKGALVPSQSVLIVTDRVELLRETGGVFDSFGLSPEIISAEKRVIDTSATCHVGMVETIHRRQKQLAEMIASKTLIVFDEAHKTAFNKLFPLISDHAYVIGATATPYRDGNQPALDEFYTEILQPVDTPDLVRIGMLADARTFGVRVDLSGVKTKAGDYDAEALAQRYAENKVYCGVVENWLKICPSKKTLCFSPTIEASKRLVEEYRAHEVDARHIDCYMGHEERRHLIDWFRRTDGAVLSNVGILTTGFNVPDIGCVVLYRATKSLPLFLQMVGRGSRTTDSKRDFYLLDFGNNVKTHGLWESERVWSLTKKKKRVVDRGEKTKTCEVCEAENASEAKECKECGTPFPISEAEAHAIEFAWLSELPKSEIVRNPDKFTIRQRVELARAGKVHKFFWLHKFTPDDLDDALKYCELLGYKKGFAWHNRERFKCFSGLASRAAD